MTCCLVCEYLCNRHQQWKKPAACTQWCLQPILCTDTPLKLFLYFDVPRQHSQSRENINFPEDEVVGGSEGGIEDIGGSASPGKMIILYLHNKERIFQWREGIDVIDRFCQLGRLNKQFVSLIAALLKNLPDPEPLHLSFPGPTMALPRASSPLTTSPMSATPTASQAPPSGDDNEPVNVTITVKATGS